MTKFRKFLTWMYYPIKRGNRARNIEKYGVPFPSKSFKRTQDALREASIVATTNSFKPKMVYQDDVVVNKMKATAGTLRLWSGARWVDVENRNPYNYVKWDLIVKSDSVTGEWKYL